MEEVKFVLTGREIKEIKHSLLYKSECDHGTAGHNQLILIAKLAMHLGFTLKLHDPTELTGSWVDVNIPPGVGVM